MKNNNNEELGVIQLAILITSLVLTLAFFVALVLNWPGILTLGSSLFAGVMAGNPMSIFIAAVILVVLAFVIFGRRRSS